MTRTVTDLVAALRPDDGADDVDTRRFLLEAARRRKLRRARQRMLAATATALAAVLLIAGVPYALTNWTGATVTPASPSPAVTPQPTETVPPMCGRPATWQTLRRTTAEPWVIEPFQASDRYQLGNIIRTDRPKAGGTVIAFDAGAFDPSALRAGRAVTISGHAGHYTVTFDPFSGDEQGNHRTEEPTIGWEYAPDAWVIVQGTFNEPPALAQPADGTVPATLLRVAEAVTIGPATPARMPFVLSYVPEGLHVVRGFVGWPGNENAAIEFDWNAAPHDWRDPTRDLWAPLAVSMMKAVPGQWRPDTTLGGLPAMHNGPNQVIVQRDGYWLSIGSGVYAPPLSTTELEKIFAGVQVADAFLDRSTWLEVPIYPHPHDPAASPTR